MYIFDISYVPTKQGRKLLSEITGDNFFIFHRKYFSALQNNTAKVDLFPDQNETAAPEARGMQAV